MSLLNHVNMASLYGVCTTPCNLSLRANAKVSKEVTACASRHEDGLSEDAKPGSSSSSKDDTASARSHAGASQSSPPRSAIKSVSAQWQHPSAADSLSSLSVSKDPGRLSAGREKTLVTSRENAGVDRRLVVIAAGSSAMALAVGLASQSSSLNGVQVPEENQARQRNKRAKSLSPLDERELREEEEAGPGAVWLVEGKGKARLLQAQELQDGNKVPDFSGKGPYHVRTAYRQEHTCAACFPDCVAGGCILKINITYPKPRQHMESLQTAPRYPLAIFSSGFLVDSEQYRSYAEHLASWGYVTLTYDKVEGLAGPLDDLVCSRFIIELIDWASSSRLMKDLVDTNRVYLCGHSRGGKVSVLAAAQDPRVSALCLIDPVDNTVYAPLAPGYPSAVAALKAGGDTIEQRFLGEASFNGSLALAIPVAVVGGAVEGDCAPAESNFRRFFRAASPPAWEVVVRKAAHFQFVDAATMMQSAICGMGPEEDVDVRSSTRAVLAAWGDLMVKTRAERRSAGGSEDSTAVGSISTPENAEREESLDRERVVRVIQATSLELSRQTDLISRLKLG